MAQLVISGKEIPYVVTRSRRKTISATVTREGSIVVKAPYIVPGFIINDFLKSKEDWIRKRLDVVENGKDNGISYQNGSSLSFFGRTILLNVRETDKTSYSRSYFLNDTLQIFLPQGLSVEHKNTEVRKRIHMWYRQECLKPLMQRVEYYAQKMGLSYKRITVKDVSSHWGSCSVRQNLNFNYRIAMLPIEVIDYVIVHELCHLKEMNHSARFWKLVEQYVPNYKELRRELRRQQSDLN